MDDATLFFLTRVLPVTYGCCFAVLFVGFIFGVPSDLYWFVWRVSAATLVGLFALNSYGRRTGNFGVETNPLYRKLEHYMPFEIAFPLIVGLGIIIPTVAVMLQLHIAVNYLPQALTEMTQFQLFIAFPALVICLSNDLRVIRSYRELRCVCD